MAKEITLQQELERLRKRAAPPGYLETKRRLFEGQVGDLSTRLRPLVERHLADEADEIAGEWLNASQEVLAALAGEAGAELRQRPQFQAAVELVRGGLAGELLGKVPPPSTEEIDSHAAELAQCVLGNWFSLLEHAKQDHQGKALRLTANAVPESAPPNALWQGVDDFAVPPGEVAVQFQGFLEAMTKSAKSEIAPSLYLVRQGNTLYCAGSEAEANRVAAPVREPAPLAKEHDSYFFPFESFKMPEECEAAYESLSSIVHHEPAPKAGFAESISFIDEEMEKIVATAAALDAVAPPVAALRVDPDKDLAAEMAELSLKELDHAVHPRRVGFFSGLKTGRLEKFMESEKLLTGGPGYYGSIQRMTVLATGLAACGAVKSAGVSIDQAKLREYFQRRQEAGQLYKIVLNSTRRALERPETEKLGVDIRHLMSLPDA